MTRRRLMRIVGPGLRVALLAAAGLWALSFLVGTISTRGAGPAAVFGVLVLAMALALLWRATLDMRKALRRLRT